MSGRLCYCGRIRPCPDHARPSALQKRLAMELFDRATRSWYVVTYYENDQKDVRKNFTYDEAQSASRIDRLRGHGSRVVHAADYDAHEAGRDKPESRGKR